MPELTEGYKDLVMVLSVPGLYCGMVLLGRRLKRHHGVRLGWLYHLFSLVLAVYLPAKLFGLQWPFLSHLGAAAVVLGATVGIALMERYLWDLYFRQRHRVKVPKFLTQVVSLLILTVAVFLVLGMFYKKNLTSLLIAPGVAAVVFGLAMQDLLGNIIAGIALQLGKSFYHGEWLFIENRYAEVIEINWRSTRLLTNDDISIEIPNREIARQTIINLNRPQRPAAMRIPVSLDYAAPPTRVKEVLLRATLDAKGVSTSPQPKVFLKNFGDSAIDYEIKFWLDNYNTYNDVSDAIRTNVWYALRRHGIRIPYPIRTLQIERTGRDKPADLQTAARLILRQQPLFQCLSDEQLEAMLPRAQAVHFGKGEKVINQGANGDSMFILVNGQAQVVVERNGAPMEVARLSSGDCFGEMSLLTGERRSATVVADTDCEVVEIGKPLLADSLREHPELLAKLSELLARRQMETEGILATEGRNQATEARQTAYAANFMGKLRSFFQL
jgi:small-conductance mechanosensitive channel/CRP-like cAMP-binding protein